MTINSTVRTAGPYIGNSVATVFPFSFKIFNASELLVLRTDGVTEIPLSLFTDYTVTLNADQNVTPGGAITTIGAPLSSTYSLSMTSNLSEVQQTALVNQGGFFPKVIEDALDRLVILIQQIGGVARRAIHFPASDVATNTELPAKAVRANNMLGFDNLGNLIAVAPAAQSATALAVMLAGSTGSSQVGFIQAGTGAALRTSQDKLRERFSVKDFGAKGDGVTNDHASITACIAAAVAIGGATIFFPRGTYLVNNVIQVGGSGINLCGEGRNSTYLKSTVNNVPVIAVTTGSNNITIQDFTIDRTVTPVAGGNGINFAVNGVADGSIYRVYVKNQWVGVALSGAGYSVFQNSFVERCKSHGVSITNSNVMPTCQWYMANVIVQLNDGNGFNIQSLASSPGLSMSTGALVACYAYANSGFGLACIGNATVPLQSMRVTSCFFGEDGSDEIYMDTYGRHHSFTDNFIELPGTSNTGSLVTTPPTHVGWGYNFTANNFECNINGGIINGCSYAGVISSTPNLKIFGTEIKYSGLSGAVGASFQSGVVVAAGAVEMIGVTCNNAVWGFYDASGGAHQIIGCNLLSNSTAAIGGAMANGMQIGNRPFAASGWGVPTGALTRTTFQSGTVTLPQLAERVAALIVDLETQRIINP